jgi:dephospho-CoA kinase|tara:strand:- start:1682 stop:2257 length:576 start_codon:yes stop_codon:yes gene_type:complete
MIRIAIVGNIGSGKSYVAKLLGFPVFNADSEVVKIYKDNYKCFKQLKKKIPKFIKSYPIRKSEISKAIYANKNNLKKITKTVHPIVRSNMLSFIKKNKKKKAVVLDIPLYFENKINKKEDIIVFVDSKKSQINSRLKKRSEFNSKIFNKFKNIQLSAHIKKKKSNFIVKNNFRNVSLKKNVKILKKKILKK